MKNELQVGDKVFFKFYKKPFTVKAVSERFAICTKPFNLQKTCLYTIIDFMNDVRGPNNLVFNMYDYLDQTEINGCMRDLMNGEVEVSRRNSVPLDLYMVRKAKVAII